MSVRLIFCGESGCFEKNVDYVDWIFMVPIEYREMVNRVKHTDGYVIYDESTIRRFWDTFSASAFDPYKFVRLEIDFRDIWCCEGFGYE